MVRSWHVPDLRRRTAYGWKAALSFSSAIETAGRCAFCSLRHRTQYQLIIEKVSRQVRSDRVGPVPCRGRSDDFELAVAWSSSQDMDVHGQFPFDSLGVGHTKLASSGSLARP